MTVHAAGGVLWRPGEDGTPRVAVVHRPRYDDWSLPKGKLDAGEQPIVGACREVLEETGVRPVLGPFLDTARYSVPTKAGTAPKRVDYWAMRAASAEAGEVAGGAAGSDSSFVPNDEVDDLAWLPLAEAERRVRYPHDSARSPRFRLSPGRCCCCATARPASG
jgi:8-oxo-dGTP pyrophosphatase MutT (NUDIX family)